MKEAQTPSGSSLWLESISILWYMRRRGGSGWVVGGKWGWLIAILKRGVVQGGRQGQRREKIYTLTKGERSVCVGKKVRRKTWVTITAEIHFLNPPNSSHTHRYCHRAIPSFQRWFKKRLQERTRFLYSRPVAMVTQNWVTPSLPLLLSLSFLWSNQHIGAVLSTVAG